MVTATSLRKTIEDRLAEYEGTKGMGADAYYSQPLYHPMADGKYLQILAVLRRSNLLSAATFGARAAKAHKRLAAAASPSFSEGWGWGLGFSYRGLPPTELFLITCAIVTRAAVDCAVAGLAEVRRADVLTKGIRGLAGWIREFPVFVGGSETRIPAYSNGLPEPIYNAAACAHATLTVAEAAGIEGSAGSSSQSALEWIRSRRVHGLGWPYSPSSSVVDLLHQCYILNALADAGGGAGVEANTVEMVGQFAGACSFADTMHLVTETEASFRGQDIPWLRSVGQHQVGVSPNPARLWSLGELLVLLSRLSREGEHGEGWIRLGRRVAESILTRLSSNDDAEGKYPRHVMHAVHGLACYLSVLRQGAQAAPNS